MSTAPTYTYAQRLGDQHHTDGLIDELREGLEIAFNSGCYHGPDACAECVIGTAPEVLRELLRTERV